MDRFNHIFRQLGGTLEQGLQQADGLLSITLPLPELHLRSLPQIPGDWLFWGRPGEDIALLGIGEASRITATGSGRLEELATHFGELQNSWLCLDPAATGVEPATFLLFAFSPDDPMPPPWEGLPNAAILLPELLLQQRDGHCTMSFTVRIHPTLQRDTIMGRWRQLATELIEAMQQRGEDPPSHWSALTISSPPPQQQEWQRLVTAAQKSIAAAQLEKVVLARRLRVQAKRQLDPAQLIATLGHFYPDSMLFAVSIGGRHFAAATPEQLAACRGSSISCSAIGGTIQRDADSKRDKQLGEQLLRDPKAQHEHALVVESIQVSLASICTTLQLPECPRLIRLRNLQHLESTIHGNLRPGIGLLDAANKLHPTAAVNGVPAEQAREWLQRNELFSRGWYSGAGGWLNVRGDGELAVLLRCALLEGDRAELFAGAGITAGSDPTAEFEETELKFNAMLEALENG